MASVTKLQLCESCKDYVAAPPCCRWMDPEEFARALTDDSGHRITYCPWNGLAGASLAGFDQPGTEGDSRSAYAGSIAPSHDAEQRAAARQRRRAVVRARLEACRECDHFVDDVNTGEPTDRPCRLRPSWNTCAWKQAAFSGEIAGDGCLWSGLRAPVELVSTGVRNGVDSALSPNRVEAKGASGTDLHK